MSEAFTCVKITIGDQFYIFGGWFDRGAEETFCEVFCREFSPKATAEVVTVEMPDRPPYHFIKAEGVPE